jgi:hypothetical protein
MNETKGHHVKWNKPDGEQVLNVLSQMWKLKKEKYKTKNWNRRRNTRGREEEQKDGNWTWSIHDACICGKSHNKSY